MMILRIGSRVMYAGREWEVFGPDVDDERIIVVVLIDPVYDAQSGKPEPTVYVRDLNGIAPVSVPLESTDSDIITEGVKGLTHAVHNAKLWDE